MKKHFKLLLSALALAIVVFAATGAVSAQAATVTYDPVADTVAADKACIGYILKNGEAATVKTTGKYVELSTTATKLTELGFKEGAAVYLYVVDAALEANAENVKANFTLAAPKANKVVGKIDYTQADNAASTAALSADVLDKEKKAVTDAVIIWSADNTAYVAANDATNGYTGAKLAASLEAGATIYIKVQGTTAMRTSKAYKVKIAKQAKAPAIKLDVKKNALNIKNGFDFAAVTKTGETYGTIEPSAWFTVLPYLKNAAIKESAASIVATSAYLPLAAKNADAAKAAITVGGATKYAYTSYKFKALGLDVLAAKISKTLNADFSFAVRKSATDKKPASAITYCDVKAQALAPQIYTKENTSSYTTIADGEKFSLKTPNLANYTSAWTDIGADVAPAEGATVDAAAAKYEMAVVKVADIATIDWSTVGWKSIKAGTKINDKTKTKYNVTGAAAATTAVLKAGSAAASEGKPYGDAETVVLIRRAGVKGKGVSDAVLASKYLTTYVYKDATSKKYVWEVAKTDAAQILVGADAYKYELSFLTWQPKQGGGFEYAKSDKLAPITGYASKLKDTTIELPELDKMAYALDTATGCTVASDKKSVTITGLDKDATASASIKVDTEYVLTLKFKGIDGLEDVVVENTYWGKEVDFSSAIKAQTGYTAAAALDGTALTDNKITVNDKAAVTVTVTYTKAE